MQNICATYRNGGEGRVGRGGREGGREALIDG